MPEENPLFRKKALQRLSSPDKLDQLVTITSTRAWIALIALLTLIILTVIWSILGSIPITVSGFGVLLRKGGIINISSWVAGQVVDITAETGDIIDRGDVIARISQTALLDKISQQRTLLTHLKEKSKTNLAIIEQKRKSYEETINLLNSRLKNKKELLKGGLTTEQSIFEVEQDIKQNNGNLNALQLDELASKQEISQAEEALKILVKDYREGSEILSAYQGRVIEVKVKQGDLVNYNTPLLSIERTSQDSGELEGRMYISAIDAKKIKPGMTAQITPTTVKPEEYGKLLGRVATVAQFPMTPEGLMMQLGNKEQVDKLLGLVNLPTGLEVSLTQDKNTISGYRWTSSNGPPLTLQTGTLCKIEVVIAEKAPIEFVVPFLKRTVGVY